MGYTLLRPSSLVSALAPYTTFPKKMWDQTIFGGVYEFHVVLIPKKGSIVILILESNILDGWSTVLCA